LTAAPRAVSPLQPTKGQPTGRWPRERQAKKREHEELELALAISASLAEQEQQEQRDRLAAAGPQRVRRCSHLLWKKSSLSRLLGTLGETPLRTPNDASPRVIEQMVRQLVMGAALGAFKQRPKRRPAHLLTPM
jgi:hypothetical protein